jgi:NAD(P)-dependent dehydrogenase (short-subunit alcohol dehydrogenase family)/acyl carrier protein
MIDHLIKPVEFLAQVEAMYRDGARVFLELGPKAVLTGLIGSILGAARPHKTIAVDAKGGGISGILEAVGQLLCAGVKLDISKLFEGRHCIDGDPADLTRMQREAPPAKHVWMLNGSGVRRFGEPVRPFGVQMDAPDAPLKEAPQSKAIQRIAPQKIPAAGAEMMPIKNRKEEPQMRRRGQAPPRRDPSVMAEYFDTMRLFLETQQSVMSTYMGVASTHRSAGTWPQRTIQPRELHNRAESPAGRTSQQTRRPDRQQIPAEAVVETPAQPDEPSASDGQKEATPAAPQPENTTAGSVQAETASQNFDEQKIAGILLSIVEEKTGYPKDMVGLEQNLEAELGIDSIKRVEIVGALLKVLPKSFKQSLDGDQGELNTQSTLKGIVNLLLKTEREGSTPVPFEQTGVGPDTCKSSDSLRYVIVSKPEAVDASAVQRLEKGHFILTQDRLEVARELSELLVAQGCTVHIVTRDVLKDEKLLNEWCASVGKDLDAVSGVVHLAQVGSDRIREDTTPAGWRRQLQLNEKSLFILLHQFSGKLREGAHILSASALGGFFNHEGGKATGLSLQGGAVGLLKSLYQERPVLRVKAVDVDPHQESGSIAKDILSELALAGGRQEVGYPEGRRTIFQTVPSPVATAEEGLEKIQNIVVLATGGLKGVTAEVLREFALPGNTLLLTGRSRMLEPEPEDLRSLETPAALREHFISQVRNGRLQLTPAKIRSEVQSILASREMRYNIEDFRKRGATVEYFPVDVTDHDGMQALLDQIYDRYGKIDGVVHGAGIIEDKLLADKSSDSWSRVVETKVIGLLLLQRYLRPESLKFFTVFSSVAGRYGNSGQTDYATANELMNRLCCQLYALWAQKVKVKALCWGPWRQTKLGTGMVTEYTEAKFAEIGVKLVGSEDGGRLFKEELTHADDGCVEIVFGEGPWEQQEAAIGRIESHSPVVENSFSGPLLHNATLETFPNGDQVITILLGETHAYLKEHRIDDVSVLPAAVALEIMSEAAHHLWPDWIVAEVRECRLMKGVELKDSDLKLNVVIKPAYYGSSDGFEVNVAIQTDQDNGQYRLHYRAILWLTQQLSLQFEYKPNIFDEKKLTAADAYNQWLFHGPRFQVIEKIDGLSEGGANALVRTTRPAQWLINVETNSNQWVFDPVLVDAAAQMAIIWCRAFRDETPLPVGFGRVIRCTDHLPDKLHMHFERRPSEEPHLVRADVYFADAENRVMLMIEDMECVSSAGLNRVGGALYTGLRSSAPNLLAKKA